MSATHSRLTASGPPSSALQNFSSAVTIWQLSERAGAISYRTECRSGTLALRRQSAIIWWVNNKHRKTLEAVWADPVNGNIEWSRIESLLIALGCRVIEGAGSSVTFDWQGRRATFHRPHPGKEALRYRVRAAREFLQCMEIKP